eukprot:2933347-Rhodomonas_salina.2
MHSCKASFETIWHLSVNDEPFPPSSVPSSKLWTGQGPEYARVTAAATGIYATVLGTLATHNNSVARGKHLHAIATGVLHPRRGYAHLFNFFDPDSYLAIQHCGPGAASARKRRFEPGDPARARAFWVQHMPCGTEPDKREPRERCWIRAKPSTSPHDRGRKSRAGPCTESKLHAAPAAAPLCEGHASLHRDQARVPRAVPPRTRTLQHASIPLKCAEMRQDLTGRRMLPAASARQAQTSSGPSQPSRNQHPIPSLRCFYVRARVDVWF